MAPFAALVPAAIDIAGDIVGAVAGRQQAEFDLATRRTNARLALRERDMALQAASQQAGDIRQESRAVESMAQARMAS